MPLAAQTVASHREAPGILDLAPGRIGRAGLVVRDLDRTRCFYEETIGLTPMAGEGRTLRLGVGGLELLTLTHEPGAEDPAPGAAGLYHTAFLLPSRTDLGAWLDHAARSGVRIDGASDHKVSEAVYLHDPEGNGVEIYADRPNATWTVIDDLVQMGSERLDIRGLMQAGVRPWSGMPVGGCVGHVHLKVGDVARADAFYATLLGFHGNRPVPTASFYGMGGYHHQLAANTWQSAGAGPRRAGSAGLAEFEIVMRDPAYMAALRATPHFTGHDIQPDGDDLLLRDPWNNGVRVRNAPGSSSPGRGPGTNSMATRSESKETHVPKS